MLGFWARFDDQLQHTHALSKESLFFQAHELLLTVTAAFFCAKGHMWKDIFP